MKKSGVPSFRNFHSYRKIPVFALLYFILICCISSSCKNCFFNHNGSQPDSTLIEPALINNNFLDSNTIKSFLSQYPQLIDQSYRIWTFYNKRGLQYAWFNNDGMIEQARLFLNLLRNYEQEGRPDSIRYLAQIERYLKEYNQLDSLHIQAETIRTNLELFLTAQFFDYVQNIWGGLPENTTKDLGWYIKRKRLPYVAILDSILITPDFFYQKKPVYRQYDLLKEQLQKYRKLVKMNNWDSIYLEEKKYKKGDSSEVIARIKERLHLLGDLPEWDSTGQFDLATRKAVMLFQTTHGLKSDGAVGEQFVKQLNISPGKRVEQIIINMERCRWVPVEPQGDYIEVNIPEFMMHVYSNDTIAWSCNVVVGNNANQTVIFNRNMKTIVFSPYWTIPSGILAKEILPACKKNPDYLTTHNMEVIGASGKVIEPGEINWGKYTASSFPYSIRQRPGADNSLGRVKFLFPNEYDIYLHDTPSKGLFGEERRNLSHGCIRVGEPERLANWLLRNDTIVWPKEKIKEAMFSEREVYVTIRQEVPVFIAYFTAWVDNNGQLNFRDDVYGHDEKLQHVLFTEVDSFKQ